MPGLLHGPEPGQPLSDTLLRRQPTGAVSRKRLRRAGKQLGRSQDETGG